MRDVRDASDASDGLDAASFVDEDGRAYVAREELGRGVLTSVRSACPSEESRRPDATLAIKTILPLWIGHPLAEARIAREREVSRALFRDADVAPPCARVLAFGRQPITGGRSRPFHVSLRLAGNTLADHLRSRSAPCARDLLRAELRWVDDLLVALEHVHAAGWVHRDVKPQNVFLRDGHAARRACLLDFGLAVPIGARRADAPSEAPAEADEPFGTPAYVSPEVIAGARIDARADLYSVGLIVFHLVAGRRPFRGDPVALLEAHLSEPAPLLRSVVPAASLVLERAVGAALAKSPGERPSTAAELRALLSAAPEF